MGSALKQFFSFITTLFTAAELLAKSVENIADAGNILSATYLREVKHEDMLKAISFSKELKLIEAA